MNRITIEQSAITPLFLNHNVLLRIGPKTLIRRMLENAQNRTHLRGNSNRLKFQVNPVKYGKSMLTGIHRNGNVFLNGLPVDGLLLTVILCILQCQTHSIKAILYCMMQNTGTLNNCLLGLLAS